MPSEHELEEMDRVLKDDGRIVIVERLCTLSESPEAQDNLRREQTSLPKWFENKGYTIKEEGFLATYWGESLTDHPQFNYYLISAQK